MAVLTDDVRAHLTKARESGQLRVRSLELAHDAVNAQAEVLRGFLRSVHDFRNAQREEVMRERFLSLNAAADAIAVEISAIRNSLDNITKQLTEPAEAPTV